MALNSAFRTLSVVLVLMLALTGKAMSQSVLIPSPPQIAGSSYVLMDPKSGRIIMEENSHERLPPASLTKMMTAYIVERELDEGRIAMSDMVPISVNAWKTEGSRTFVREGTQVSVEDLLRGVIIQSGNDASVALAEFVAGSEGAFVDIMNQQAQLLGMKDTNFVNATGLPSPEHFSTAYDLAMLARAIINDYPENYPLYAEKHFTYNNIRQPNRNSLLWRDDSVDGLKTGHTEEAGYCLVASAKRNDTRFIAVVMGTNSSEARAQEIQKMLNYGFRYYESERLFRSGQELIEARVWGGQADQLSVGMTEDVYVTIPRGSRNDLESTVDLDSVIKAPIKVGDELGRVKVSYNGEVLVDQPVLALTEVPEGGFFKRIWDAIKLFFIQLFQ
ncbi:MULTISPECIES: D-alanyl-D-alanine carboxypeptidase family protein [unclassified Marinobacter]|jgi:D-alanyl-D-alanine carboxypeptidase (penicillin-binding protein 5/6)|uniref:D-alanyl-D-alanine carboxypeptidase family protein n=1 Tax=Marinobacter TaxID=2742 RepID=UPI00069DD2A1|nr:MULTISPECIES: D-alanyl-D-alanine carboxypeptidase family protein [unclassified Marinobacter]MBI48118.1 D-alanyl-D-alanine carboxypeptidase [Marinobacter sp.]MCK5865786.1 D-alanyl-D-alanine carboxypeptidase [Marinobacter adhaerens]MCP4062102.1 D-alanyl-D-alanine carboxypeptidase [Gammaproteobacteria bacterium]PTB99909.1 D-alanyl-D-alanine carboxypeptidase [Marinobacter sp. Z-F4-2]AKV97253.1 D-alanyl-D-alanine carboxypeptidase [Marinobacter sp. CP1]|tara:strand:- start:3607 stop:4773 length:1167 start_codon:yes stop_codon:yes gene_type:complete